ncbi:MAG: diguanylate cyclase [Desulfurococcales archaeon]|jgi:membrane dipeptidase|nr:diguanylate cyclase [Desulfurococcales archaeon]
MMGANKKYSGYTSWQFFEPGKDYKPFRLARVLNRVPSTVIQLSKAEEERVAEIIEKNILISFHDHAEIFPEDPKDFIEYERVGRPFIGYEGLAKAGFDAFFDGLKNGIALARGHDPWSIDNVIWQIGMVQADLDHQDLVFIGRKVEDIEKAFKEGKIAMIIHIEGAPHMGEELEWLDVLYGLGVRCMGIAYSRGNEYGGGLADKIDKGLTDLGYELIDRMNKLGILIDIAHAGDKTSLEVIEYSRYPVAITHAGARALWPSRRMKPDEVIQALAERGGVFGVEAAPHTTITKNNPRHSIESIMEHFQYIEKLVGIDHVAFGPDTLFGDHVALHKVFRDHLSITRQEEDLPPYPRVEYVDGLENPAEFVNIIRWLVKHGYSDQEIAKVVGGNILNLLKRVWR